MITIRKATLDDLRTVHEIEVESFDEGSYPLFVLRQMFDISEHYFLVAEEEQQILGYALGNISVHANEGWILSLGVHPQARGKKIGKALVKELIATLENNNSKIISLTVHPDNTSAIGIYKEFNFEIIHTDPNYYFDNEARLLMRKKAITSRIND